MHEPCRDNVCECCTDLFEYVRVKESGIVPNYSVYLHCFAKWDMLGQSFRLSEKWMGPIITKILITSLWRLNTLIDAGQEKPADVSKDLWNTLVRRRKTEDSQVMFEYMRAISQGKGSRTAQLKAIERDSIVKLVSFGFALFKGDFPCLGTIKYLCHCGAGNPQL